MKTPQKIAIIAALAVTVAAAIVLKQDHSKTPVETNAPTATTGVNAPAGNTAVPAASTAKLPKLIDLGKSWCVPCKMMKPILDDLKANYADSFITEFIDLEKAPDAGMQYGVEMIPTQIFYDAEGKELFRHTGFLAKEDILGKWKELGVDLGKK